ncbi:hypothetical protein GGX14DRAFT_655895 [Mycena pura]|uniref:RING-type domain-containing protein n=1 Tax=Mycena pura TaxID=153505 RepID=A0AAD6V3B0_9AGAR|nr:hypothetical protein GGX14DRAFT_655895 [Mycena pura]
MVYLCRQCPTREFGCFTSFKQHVRQSAGHPFCHECDEYCYDQERLDIHNNRKHPQFFCRTCNSAFLTQGSLEDHFRGKAPSIHPKCPRCGKGFFNKRIMDEHFKAAHPRVKCVCTGGEFFEEDLQKHYLDSPSHPSCFICNIGFKDNEACNKHGAATHPERRCTVCNCQFVSIDGLKEHFATAVVHPKCPSCYLGFLDDAALNEHFTAEHYSGPPSADLSFGGRDPQFQNLLAMESAPAPIPAPRTTNSNLPPPGRDTNERWNATENKVAGAPSLLPTATSNALVAAPGDPTFWTPANELIAKSLEDSRTQSSVLFQRATADALRKHPAVMWHPGKLETTTLRKRPTATEETGIRANSNYERTGLQLSSSTSAYAASVSSSSDTATASGRTTSPQSDSVTDRSESSPYGSQSDLDSTQSMKREKSARLALRCMRCHRVPCTDPTVTLCGHLYCSRCITEYLRINFACPKCSVTMFPSWLVVLRLDD